MRLTLRGEARAWLHAAGGSESGGRALMELATKDAVLAGFIDVSQATVRAQQWAFGESASAKAMDDLDALEVAAWSRAMGRVKTLAGES